MPTAAKLFAALAFAAVGWMAAEAYRPLMPDHTPWGRFVPISVALGLICGWRVMGPRAGRGWASAMGIGLSTSAVLLTVALFVLSFHTMILRALDRRYDGVLEALVGVFAIMLDYAARMVDLQLLAVLVLGGVAGGLASEAAGRLWR